MAPLIGLLDCLPHQVRAEAAERHGLKDPRAVTLVCVHVRCKGDVLPIGPAQAAYRAAPGGAGADVHWRRRAGAAGAAGVAGVAGAAGAAGVAGAAVVEDAAAGAAADAPDEGCNQRSSEVIRGNQRGAAADAAAAAAAAAAAPTLSADEGSFGSIGLSSEWRDEGVFWAAPAHWYVEWCHAHLDTWLSSGLPDDH
jgi:hypothetical protein